MKTELKKLKSEMAALRAFVIGMAGRDPEGEYRPEFVRKIRRLEKEPPTFLYKGPGDLLKQIRGK